MIFESTRKMTAKEQMAFDLGYAKALGEIERLTAERDAEKRRADAAVKCIRDVETYGELGSLVYMMRTIAKWRGPCAENMEGGPTDEA